MLDYTYAYLYSNKGNIGISTNTFSNLSIPRGEETRCFLSLDVANKFSNIKFNLFLMSARTNLMIFYKRNQHEILKVSLVRFNSSGVCDLNLK